MATGDVASPGHKLGQIVGVLLEQLLGDPLRQFASRHQLYCDCKGSRPGVRTGNKSAAMWRAIEQDYRLFERKMASMTGRFRTKAELVQFLKQIGS